jgi:hypothetical protein
MQRWFRPATAEKSAAEKGGAEKGATEKFGTGGRGRATAPAWLETLQTRSAKMTRGDVAISDGERFGLDSSLLLFGLDNRLLLFDLDNRLLLFAFVLIFVFASLRGHKRQGLEAQAVERMLLGR